MASIENIINLNRGEVIELQVGRSLWAWFWPATLACLLIVAPFFAMYPLFSIGIIGIIIYLILICLGLILLLRVYVCKKNTAFLMTNYRITDIEQRGFINRVALEIPYDKIKSVQYVRSNIADLFLGLGDVYVYLTDNISKIKLSKVRNYKDVAGDIYECRRRYYNEKK
ncbi:MAG: PH domain-containing protein [Candidatus Buchananbacteria bacterium]